MGVCEVLEDVWSVERRLFVIEPIDRWVDWFSWSGLVDSGDILVRNVEDGF
jgi:hypothetical protein